MTSVVDVVRTYMDAASGLTRLTRQRAVVAAKTLLKVEDRFAGDSASRDGNEEATRGSVGAGIQSLASELVATSAANREALGELVQGEMDRVLSEAGYVRREDHDRLLRRVADLERRLAAFPSSAGHAYAGDAAVGGAAEARPQPAASTEPPGEQGIPAPRDPAQSAAAEADPASAEDPVDPTAGAPTATAQPGSATAAPADSPAPDSAAAGTNSATESAPAQGETDDAATTAIAEPNVEPAADSTAEPAAASTRSTKASGKSATKSTGKTRATKATTKKNSAGKTGKSK